LYQFQSCHKRSLCINGSTQRTTYTATERFSFSDNKIVQNNEGGFTVKNIEIKTFYNDPADESNYYLYKYSDSSKPIIKYYADEDTFFQGNEFFSISQNDDLKIGDKVTVSHYGISKEYYNYINILVSISGNGGPS
jgi:hypothetical protein